MLILPPGHQAGARRPRQSGLRQRFVPAIGGLLMVALIAVTIFSLTSHAAKSAKGCLNFSYTTVMGSETVHECDAPARRLCADPHRAAEAQGNIAGLEDDLIAKLPQNCRLAGLPYRTAS
jgi:hypothetical protein